MRRRSRILVSGVALLAVLAATILGRPAGASSVFVSPTAGGSAAVGPDASREAAAEVSVDDSDPTVRYRGTWTTGKDAGKYGGGDHYTDERGASAELTFTATSVSVRGARAPWHGDLTVSIDGGAATTISAYAANRSDDVELFGTSGLAGGSHTIEVVASGGGDHGAVVALDRFVVGSTTPGTPKLSTPPAPSAPTAPSTVSVPVLPAAPTEPASPVAIDDDEFSYQGPWSTSRGSAKLGGGDHYSDSSGATATLTFTGTGATIVSATAPWHGQATFSVDGGPAQPRGLQASTRTDQQPIFRVTGLTPGRHTIMATVTGQHNAGSTGTVVSIDGAEVQTGAGGSSGVTPPPASSSSSVPDPTTSAAPTTSGAVPTTSSATPTTSTATPTTSPAPTTSATSPPSSPSTSVPTPTPATSSWVTRNGSRLQLDGQPFRFSGANLYWLGLDDNLRDSSGQPTHPTHARIDNGLSAAVSVGLTVVRSHSMGISVGCPGCIEPTLGVFDDSAFESADFALYRAGQLGLKMIIPLTDQWRYYHGGISTFTAWRGYPNDADLSVTAVNSKAERAAESNFYTDARVVADFQQYVSHLLDHVNPYTGLAWKNDPTVMAWETGNELWTASPGWTQQIAAFIKHSVGARALVADGSGADGMHVADAAVDAPDVDMVSGHFYPVDTGWARSDAAVAAAHGKVYYVGEYAWTDLGASSDLLSAAAADPNVSGDLVWSILPYLENGTPEQHGDGYALYVPATSDPMRQFTDLLAAHATVMSGR
ncbi:hypothetical protein [Nakamurella sp. UYEF19]|uniref:hypothetical protein n=1 Tax=Nakamurella sp. UYEF19 TaxID=1756392 RepID=UPI00339465CC